MDIVLKENEKEKVIKVDKFFLYMKGGFPVFTYIKEGGEDEELIHYSLADKQISFRGWNKRITLELTKGKFLEGVFIRDIEDVRHLCAGPGAVVKIFPNEVYDLNMYTISCWGFDD